MRSITTNYLPGLHRGTRDDSGHSRPPARGRARHFAHYLHTAAPFLLSLSPLSLFWSTTPVVVATEVSGLMTVVLMAATTTGSSTWPLLATNVKLMMFAGFGKSGAVSTTGVEPLNSVRLPPRPIVTSKVPVVV